MWVCVWVCVVHQRDTASLVVSQGASCIHLCFYLSKACSAFSINIFECFIKRVFIEHRWSGEQEALARVGFHTHTHAHTRIHTNKPCCLHSLQIPAQNLCKSFQKTECECDCFCSCWFEILHSSYVCVQRGPADISVRYHLHFKPLTYAACFLTGRTLLVAFRRKWISSLGSNKEGAWGTWIKKTTACACGGGRQRRLLDIWKVFRSWLKHSGIDILLDTSEEDLSNDMSVSGWYCRDKTWHLSWHLKSW